MASFWKEIFSDKDKSDFELLFSKINSNLTNMQREYFQYRSKYLNG